MTAGRGFRQGSLARGGRRIRRWCWRVLAVLVVLAAVVVGIGRLLAPHADQLRPAMERYLTSKLGQPVRIARVEAEWPRLSPRVELHGLSIGPPQAPDMEIGRARLGASLLNLARPARNTLQLVVLDLDLVLSQDADGQWQWQLERGVRLAGNWQRNLDVGDLVVRDARVRVEFRRLGSVVWNVAEADLHRDGNRISARLEAHPADDPGRPAEIRVRARLGSDGLVSMEAWLLARDLTAEGTVPQLSGSGDVSEWRAGIEAWLDWHVEKGLEGQARLELHSMNGVRAPGGRSGRFDVRGRWMPGDWAVQIDGIGSSGAEGGPADPAIRRLAIGRRDGRTGAVADAVDLDFAHVLLAPWLPEIADRVTDLSGRITDLSLGIDTDGSPFLLRGRGQGIVLELADPGVRVEGLDVNAELAGDQAMLRLSGAPAVDWPEMLRVPVQLDNVAGRVGWRPGAVRLDRIRIGHSIADAEMDGWIHLGPAGPFLDFRVIAPRVEPGDPRPWLPHGIIPDRVHEWLDRALVSVSSARGDLVFHGRPRNWRERGHAGSFSADVEFTGLELDYWQDWPRVDGADGEILFAGRGFSGRVDSGRVAGVALRGEVITLESYDDRVLHLELATPESDAADLATLAASFPVSGLAEVLAMLSFSGPAAVEARVDLPMRSMPEWKLEGRATLAGVELTHAGSGYRLRDMHGRVPFDRDGFRAPELEAAINGAPPEAPVVLAVDAAFQPAFRMSVDGEIPAAALLPPAAGAWPVFGASRWVLEIDRGGDRPEIRLASDLAGTGIALPEPLAKLPAEFWPVELSVPLAVNGEPVRFELARRAAGLLIPGTDDWRLGLRLGPGDPPLPRPGRRLEIAGRIPVLDLAGWMQQASGRGGSIPELPSAGLQVRVDRIDLGEREWPALALAGESGTEGRWHLELDGEAVSGRAARSGSDAPVVVELERLHWPEVEPDPDAERRMPRAREPSRADPRRLPALDIRIEDLQWGGFVLGRMEAAARPMPEGLEIESLEATGPGISLSASGRWELPGDSPHTRGSILLEADNLARSLRDAGFDIALEGGRARISLDGRWPGAPTDFSLETVDGVLDVRITDGVIPEARPGAGRLLGLVSLNSIPRRLRLDFRDVFGAGLSFDSMSGEFRLSSGLAQTDGLEIDAPAAGIRIRGITDLVERRYDQQIRVQPGLGSTLPIIGALTGGPVGAAAGVALQQLLDRPLRGLSEVHYRITGSWDDPRVELVGAEPAEASEMPAESEDG